MLPAIFPFKLVGVMQELIKTATDSGTELAAHQYLIVCLIFVHAVILQVIIILLKILITYHLSNVFPHPNVLIH